MLCNQLISNLIPALSTKDTPDRALQIMDEYHLSQLPILQGNNYIGLVFENELLDLDVTNKPFDQLNFDYIPVAVPQDAHVYEALKLVSDFKISVIPVVTDDRKYVGSISQDNLLLHLAAGTQYTRDGGTIVVAINEQDYSLSQLARISESDNINILSLHVVHDTDNKMILTIKTNKQDVRSLVASLERFNYEILEVHSLHNNELDVQDNYESFMKYINM